MEVTLKYGSGSKTLTFPDNVAVTRLEPHEAPVVDDVPAVMKAVLEKPLGMEPLALLPVPRLVAVAVPDETRPVPLKVLLPLLLEHLFAAWPALRPQQVRIVVGGGLHMPPDQAQLGRILPHLPEGVEVVSHDANHSPMKSYGKTSRGVPVEINAAYAEADFKVVIGQVDPHQFVGMTGGAKGVVVGCASAAMIQANHAMMADPRSKVSAVDDNPVRQDMNESGRMVGIDLAVNIVMNARKQVVALSAGRPEEAMLACVETTRKVYGIAFDAPFDIAVASCGGNPKDICLYQAQKGLNMASSTVKEGGRILLLAACLQGIGDDVYENYIGKFSSPQSQMEEFGRNGFRMGAHKALLFSRTLIRNEVVVDSEMSREELAHCLLTKGDAQATLDAWLAENPQARVAVIPNANASYFYQK